MAKWGLLAAIVAVAVGAPYFYREVDRRLRTEIEALLADRYPHLKVALRSAELVQESEREGILLRGLSLAEPDGQSWTPLVECEEVFLSCPTDLAHLAKKEVAIRRIFIRRPTLYLRRNEEGAWNFQNLQPQGSLGKQRPEILVEEGTAALSADGDGSGRPILLRDLQAAVSPSEEVGPEAGGETTVGKKTDIRRVQISLSGQGLQQLRLEGWVDLAAGDYAFQGRVDNWELTPEWQEVLPILGVDAARRFGAFQGQMDVSFQVSHRPSQQEPIRWEASGRLTNGRLHDRRLPYPLTDIWAVFRADADGLRVDQLFARHGAATLRVSYRANGYRANSPMHLEAEIRQLELRREWLDLLGLHASLGRHWDLYRPSGHADIYLTLDYDGQHWFPEATVDCTDISVLYAKFPYRLDHGRGRLELRNDALWVQLSAFSENQPVRIAAEILHPLTQPSGWVEIQGQGLPIDQKLFDALSEPTRRFLAPLRPQGVLDVVYRWRRERPEATPHRQILLQVNRGAVCYDRFPYPIRNLRGTLEFLDGRWEFWGLTGSNGSAQIRGYGRLIPLEESPPPPEQKLAEVGPKEKALDPIASFQPLRRSLPSPTSPGLFQSIFGPPENLLPPMELYLNLTAEKVPLDEELRDALPSAAQRLWSQLRPTGQVNLQELEIRYRTGQPAAQVRFTAQPIAERSSIEPAAFPYRLEKLQGTIFFAQDQVFWQGFRAEHGQVRVAADVFGRFQPDGAWRLEMENLFVDRLPLDRELTKALPEQLKKAFAALNPEGVLALRGRWELAQSADPAAGQTSQWDLALTLVGVHLHPGIPLEHIHGGVRLAGHYTGQDYRSWGELELDSLVYQGCQITQLQGPFWIDNQYILFGPDAETRRQSYLAQRQDAAPQTGGGQPGRLVAGQWFGGQMTGQGWIRLGPEAEFALRATVSDADLARIAQEHLPGVQALRGKVYGWVYLHGQGKNLHALAGRGALHLREADIYELPVMIALLKVLNLRRPDTNAFSACDLDYRIAGPHIYLDRIVFQGDAVSLHGAGETNFQGELNLALSPMLGREDRKPPVLKQLLGGAGQEFMVIRITGSLQDPKTDKQVFPTLNQALQNLAGSSSGQWPAAGPPRFPTPLRRLPPKPLAGLAPLNAVEAPTQNYPTGESSNPELLR